MTEPEELAVRLETLGQPRILVIGDLMLDRYVTGRVERVSPEAPVLVLRDEEQEVRPGGAASVASLLSALGAEVSLAGVVGRDAEGRVLQHLLDECGVDRSLLITDEGRPTTLKQRFLGRVGGDHVQPMLRVDRESRTPVSDQASRSLAKLVARLMENFQAVLVSDYAKGVCTPILLRALREAATQHRVPVLIDPHHEADYEAYRGAALLKPNRTQAERATCQLIVTPEDALRAGQKLCARYGLGAALVTLDRDGMVLVEAEGRQECLAAHCRDVRDITGAGDMVLAVMGLCRAADWSLADAARLANIAAGLEVERLGVASVTRDEIVATLRQGKRGRQEKQVSQEQFAALVRQYRQEGKRIVFTNGCFDLLHVGHLACLEEAAQQGDVLIVAVNSDASVRRLKGPRRPVVSEHARAKLLAALTCVSLVVIFDDDTPERLLERIRPDVLVKGGTTSEAAVVGRDLVESYGGMVFVTGALPGSSTSELLTALR